MICPLCNNTIKEGDLVYVGSPKEIPMCYWCFHDEIADLVYRLGGQLKGYYDEHNILHVSAEARFDK